MTDVAARVAAIRQRFEEAPQRAREERDQALRALAVEQGLRQTDLIALTGYSRETVRQALNPVKRDEIRARRKGGNAQ